MKIVNKIDSVKSFSSLPVGECFMYLKEFYIKIKPINTAARAANALCLTNSIVVYMCNDWVVKPVVAELHIHGIGD